MSTLALDAVLRGAQLIEASAGTGKTFTIAALYLRFVLEQGRLPKQILVVTFTNAATAELRDRIRHRLARMLRRVESEDAGTPWRDDAFCNALFDKLNLADAHARALARRRLAAALHAFDDAAISTIHGFCQRALADRAFASGLPFERELMPEPGAVLGEVVADFWRRKVVAWDPADADVLPQDLHPRYVDAVLAGDPARGETPDGESHGGVRRAGSPAELAAFVQAAFAHHDARIEGGEAVPPRPGLDAGYAAAWAALRAAWPAQIDDLAARLAELRSPSYRAHHVASRRAAVEVALQIDDIDAVPGDVWAKLDSFRESRITEKTDGKSIAHPLAQRVDELCAVREQREVRAAQWRAWTRRRCLAYVREHFAARMREARAQSYDDLLIDLRDALADSAGGALGRALAAQYPAALIDEFQDTDPLQFDIFSRIYREMPPADHALVFVGDPKQAIYGFRGADLHAYLRAGDWATRLPPLSQNFRAQPRLLAAVNAVFETPRVRGDRAFRMEGLEFRPAQPGEHAHQIMRIGGIDDGAPFVLARLPAAAAPTKKAKEAGTGGSETDDTVAPINKGEARAAAANGVAAEIARLLDPAGDARLGDAPLAGRDIAVLVGNHAQGELMRAALAHHGIGSAARSRDSVYASDEAQQLLRVFAALAEPQHDRLVRAALATDLVGCDALDLQRRANDEHEAQAWRDRLAAWAAQWRRRGALALLRTVLIERHAYARLAADRRGERRLTNLAHLAELIAREESRLQGPDALVAWLQARVADPPRGEETELRLESDENLVQIVTIHTSKGLEYPVVFVPFLWEAVRARGSAALYHEPAPPHCTVLDLAPDAAARECAQAEEFEQALRIAYVALTRAKNRCTVVWGEAREAQASPLAWLLFGCDPAGERLPGRADIERAFGELAARADGTITVRALNQAAGGGAPGSIAHEFNEARLAAVVPPQVPGARITTSFSGLMHSASAADSPDHDQFVAPAAAARASAAAARELRFAFPRGAAAGDCLHAIAERIDWQAAPAAWQVPIADALRAARYDEVDAGALGAWLDEIRRAPLACPRTGARFALGEIAHVNTRRELEFMLPLERTRFAEFARRARDAGYAVPALATAQLDGWLRGFVDLVFMHEGRVYVADYKSNHLGAQFADYDAAALGQAMDAHGYHLQHLLYTLALDRWLSARIAGYDYDAHFGGVFYLFVRGMAPATPGAGVHATRPPRALIADLSALLDGGAA